MTHTMNTIQLLLSHATVWVSQLQKRKSFFFFFFPKPWECMSIRGRLKTIGQINLGSFWKLVFIAYFVDIWLKKKKPTCFESYKCTLSMSVHVGIFKKEKKKKKAGNVISDLAPYYTACFHFMPVSLLFFHMYDFEK